MSATINGTRQVTGQLAADIAGRARTLRSQATSGLLVTSVLTVLLLAVVALVSTIVARSLTRPLRKLRLDALDVASRRLPEVVRRLSRTRTMPGCSGRTLGTCSARARNCFPNSATRRCPPASTSGPRPS